jgi:hypothetical protein
MPCRAWKAFACRERGNTPSSLARDSNSVITKIFDPLNNIPLYVTLTALRSALIQLMNPKPRTGAKCLRHASLEWGRLASNECALMSRERLSKIALIGNYLPRKCGIATFTCDLRMGFDAPRIRAGMFRLAVNDRPEGSAYSKDVRFEIAEQDLPSYRLAADFLQSANVEVLCVQNEFGIYGGAAGTVPGFAAHALMKSLGTTAAEIDIRRSCMQMLKDLRHPFGAGEPIYDVTFENVQEGERTSHLLEVRSARVATSVPRWTPSQLRGWRSPHSNP